MSHAEARQRVVREALEWVGTPYVPHQQTKGAGCDCATILAGVYGNAGVVEPFNIVDKVGHYPVEWNLHQDVERYLEGIFEWADTVNSGELGNFGLFKMGRTVAHSGIVVGTDPVQMVHAWRFHGTNHVEVTTWSPFWQKHFYCWMRPRAWRDG
jgi:cell wall-associated NlpC family hydrolase